MKSARAGRRLSLASIVAAIAFAQEPQALIRVEVKAESKPVADAGVTIRGRLVRSGEDGVATATVPLGPVPIEVVKEGFFAARALLQADSAGEFRVQITLNAQEEVKEAVTVSATRSGARIQESPLHVEVLQREEIEEETAMRPGDVVMLLNEMGGMRVQTTSPSLGAATVRVQGMLGRYTVLLSDGLPLFGQQGAGLGLLQIPPIDLGQVEVIKGNASALYGGSAMAGVVDLISRRPKGEPIHEILLNASTRGAVDGSVFLAGPLSEKWSASLLGSGDGQVGWDLNGDHWADLAAYKRGVLRPRFYRDDQEGNTALLSGGVTYEDRTGGTMPGEVLPGTGQPYREALLTRRYDAGGNVQRLVWGERILTARASHSELVHRHTFGERTEEDRHELSFAEVSLRGTAKGNTWVMGGAGQRDAYRPHDVPRFAYTYTTGSAFLQDDWSVTRWLSVSGSGRVDVHNVYGTFFSPRVSALLREGGWTSRISAGQGFFASTALTEETEAAGLSRLEMRKPLVAERGRSASADLTRTAGALTVTATLFASNVDHPVFVERTGSYEIMNLGGPRKNRGVELLGTWRRAPFAATFSYGYVRASELEPGGARRDVPLTPRHTVGFIGTWEAEGKGRVGVECYYTGEQRLENNPYRESSRPYVLVGALGERRIHKHAKLFLNLENLSNVRQTRWDPLLLPRRGLDGRWTVDAWAPLEGRVINGGIRFSF